VTVDVVEFVSAPKPVVGERDQLTPWLVESLATEAVTVTGCPCSIVGEVVGLVIVTPTAGGVVVSLLWQPARLRQAVIAQAARIRRKGPAKTERTSEGPGALLSEAMVFRVSAVIQKGLGPMNSKMCAVQNNLFPEINPRVPLHFIWAIRCRQSARGCRDGINQRS
jgi:hypothetical protein